MTQLTIRMDVYSSWGTYGILGALFIYTKTLGPTNRERDHCGDGLCTITTILWARRSIKVQELITARAH